MHQSTSKKTDMAAVCNDCSLVDSATRCEQETSNESFDEIVGYFEHYAPVFASDIVAMNKKVSNRPAIQQ